MKTLKNTTLIVVAMLAICSSTLWSQTFSINSSSTFINAGQINFINNNGKFMSGLTQAQFTDASVFNNSGTINFAGSSCSFTDLIGNGDPMGATAPGSSASFRIPGYASYSKSGSTVTGLTQSVQPRWYQSLYVSDAASYSQSFSGAIYVSGTYSPSGATVSRNYAGASGTFFYDGSSSQTITGGENYSNLTFQNGGTKNILAGASVNAGTFSSESSNTMTNVFGTLAVNANGTLNISSGTIVVGNGTDSGTISIATGSTASFSNAKTDITRGSLVAAATSTYSVNGNSSTLSLADNGTIDMAANSLLKVNSGVFTNSKTDRLNMNFDPASMITYYDDNASGTQTIVSTSGTKPYGNFNTSGSATKVPNGDVYTRGSLTFSGGDINMGTDLTTGNTFTQMNPSNNANYVGMTEVIGRYRISNSFNAFTAGQSYVFNNQYTATTFTSGSITSIPTSYFEVSVNPNTFPTYTFNNPASTITDVKRRVIVNYDGSPLWTMQAAYKRSETGLSSTLGGNGGWDDSYTENMLRFYEGTSSTYEKMATSTPYTRVNSTANTWGYVYLPGFNSATVGTIVDGIGDKYFGTTNELLFRSGPALLTTIADGRWSNPSTWDEGVEPAIGDQTLIRHTVWAGFTRPIDNWGKDERDSSAQTTTGNVLASNITIDDNIQNASLILGGISGEKYLINDAPQPGVASSGNMTVGTWLTGSNSLNATTLTATTQTDLAISGSNAGTKYGGFYLLNGQTFNVPIKFNVKTGGYTGTAPGSVVNVGK